MTETVAPFPHEPERIRAWTLAARHLCDGRADAALEVLREAGFSTREAERIIATILDDQDQLS